MHMDKIGHGYFTWVFRYSMIGYILLEMINIHECETFVRLKNVGKFMNKPNKLNYSKLVQVYEPGENNSLLMIHNSNNSMLRTIFLLDDNGNSNSFRATFYRLVKA